MAPRPPSKGLLNQLAKLRLSRLRSGKSSDDVLLNYRCPKCKQNTIFAEELEDPQPGFDFNEFKEREDNIRVFQVRCACDRMLDKADVTALQFDHYFPGVKRDLQMVTWGGKERLLYRMNTQGARQQLDSNIEEDGLHEIFDLPAPILPTWEKLLVKVQESLEPASHVVENGHILAALPQGDTSDETESLAGIPETNEFSTSAYAVYLDTPFWAGRFTEIIARGTARAFVLFDPESVRQKIQNIIDTTDLKYVAGPDSFTLRLGNFYQKFTTFDIMQYAALSAVSISMATSEILSRKNKLLENAVNMYADIALLCGEFKLFTQGQRAYLQESTTGKKVGFDIYEWAERGAEGDELQGRVEALVSRLTSMQPPITCSCGRPSWIGKHLRPPHWLDGDNSTVAFRTRGDIVEIYTVECKEHFTPLHDEDLEKIDANLDDLDDLWLRSMERNAMEIRTNIIGDGKRRIVFAVGINASDLALHPGLIASLFKGLEIELNQEKPHVNIYLPTTNSIVLYWEATYDQLRSSFDHSLKMVQEFLEEPGEDLNYFDGLLIFSEPRGKLKILMTLESEK